MCVHLQATRTDHGFTKQSSNIEKANKNAVYEIWEVLDFINFYDIIIKQFID